MTSSPQDQSPTDTDNERPSRELITFGGLGVAFIFVLITALFILYRPQVTVSEPTSTTEQLASIQTPEITTTIGITLIPVATSTQTPAETFTPKPTRTPTKSPTPSGTPLPTLPPSLTPAFPGEFNDQYDLVFWTPELASQLIDIMEAYPETLSIFARGINDQGYYDAFQYAIFAQREALLQFPTASQASDWTWRLAYNLARTSDPSAGEMYANMITQELNSGRVSLEDLYQWGLDQSPQLIIEVIPLEGLSSDLNSSLVEVSAAENGSSFFWLIENPNGFTSHPLTSDFNFAQPSEVDYFIEELLGDNNAIVGTYPTTIYDSFTYITPGIFSLVQQPPSELQFDNSSPPEIGPEFKNNWESIETASGEGDLQFIDTIFPACPVTVRHTYGWNGTAFSFLEDTYQIQPDLELLSFCEIVVNHAISVWGLEPTIQLMETLLPSWPPAQTTAGGEYPEDALDEWRYRLSVYHALLGNQAESVGYANAIISDPVTPDSQWIVPAIEFLDAYQEQRDIYKSCLPSVFCNPRLAFQSLAATITAQEYPDLIEVLEDAGVTIRSNGFFDFDKDGESERWVVIRHNTGTPLEFWIVFPTDTGINVLFVETLETDNPRVTYLEPDSEPPVVLIDPDITFKVERQGPEDEKAIVMVEQEVVYSSDLTGLELDRLEDILLTGGDPSFVREELIVLRQSPFFTCSYLYCPRYLYLLGLASELANDERAAVDAYLELWRDYLDHPYATMARFKLLSTITPPPTLTPTNTASPTVQTIVTQTPTITGSPTITTPTMTLTPAPTGETQSPTLTITPTFTVTPEGYVPP